MAFQRVYHFISRDFGLDDLRQRRLKIATIEDLNDPFELRGMALTDARKRWAIASWRRDISRQIGLLCFSKSWRNPVQWSHYAQKHAGLCLGFDVDEQYLMPVRYRSAVLPDLVSQAAGQQEPGEGAVRQLLTTKYSHWRYEQEVRMFLDLQTEPRDGALSFHAFGEDMRLVEVVVGAQSTVTRSELAAALGDGANGVSTFKARLAFRSFKIVRQRRESLWL